MGVREGGIGEGGWGMEEGGSGLMVGSVGYGDVV